MNENELSTIIEACKDVRISAEYGRLSQFPALKVLGQRLDKIRIDSDRPVHIFDDSDTEEDTLDYREIAEGWNECSNVRDLEVHSCNPENAKAIVATPKERVKILYISPPYEMEEGESKKVLNTFAEGLSGIEKIEYLGARLSGDAFDKLISKNKSTLREVHFMFFGGFSSKEMDTYLPLFLKCPGLEKVSAPNLSRMMADTLLKNGVICYFDASKPYQYCEP